MEGLKRIEPDELEVLAKEHGVSVNNICVMCGQVVVVMAFRNMGVCCEDHRKLRDNDTEPLRGYMDERGNFIHTSNTSADRTGGTEQ